MAGRIQTEQVRRNLEIANRRTSFALEVAVWDSLVEICRIQSISVDELCETIVAASEDVSMASAIRVYVMEYFLKMDEKQRQQAA